MSVSGSSSSANGLRLLSFDGGGIRVISQALMVREMMHRVEEDHQLASPPKVSDYFDMICGSGLGGLLAIMCGILHMTGDQLVEEVVGLCKVLFSAGLSTAQRTDKLEANIKRLVRTYCAGGEEREMICTDDKCKTFVCAATSHNAGHPRLFRNYRSRANPSPNCKLWEAARATTALPNLFAAIVIWDRGVSETFVGGELRWNNPTEELTKEAARVFTSRYVACIVSIGSGHPGHLSLEAGLTDLFPRIASDCERLADDMERRFVNEPDVFWRMSVAQGLQGLTGDLSNLDALVSHTYSYLHGARANHDMDALLIDLTGRPERVLVKEISGEISPSPKVVRPKLCPQPTKYFTGRQAELGQLEDHFDSTDEPCHVAVLYGIGGGGKTQVGLEFIRRNRARFSAFFFVDASSKLTLETDLSTVAFELSEHPSVEDGIRTLRSREDNWLLFFDNADDTTLDLQPYLSFPHGNILITTRNRDVRAHAPSCSIWVDRLELQDARVLLLRGIQERANSEMQDVALKIVQELGCLALAINQARAFLAKGLCTLDEYLQMYKQNHQQLLRDHSSQKTDDYRHSMYTTWTISFEKLSPNASLLLQLLSFMHHEAIPAQLFEDAWRVFRTKDGDVVPPLLISFLSVFTASDSSWDILRFRSLIGEILSFSLIEFDPCRNILSLHPLVHQWGQSRSQPQSNMVHSTQTLLALAIQDGDTKEHYLSMRVLLPHLRDSVGRDLTLHYSLLSQLGHLFRRHGLFRESSMVFQKELSELQLSLGAEHLHVLKSMCNVAESYSLLGQYQESLKLNTRVLELQKQVLGDDHEITLSTVNNLAVDYVCLKRYHDAQKLIVQVLDWHRQTFGEDHPKTLESMEKLAQVHRHLGQYENAQDLQEQVLALRIHIFGEEHPLTVTSMNTLFLIYMSLEQYHDALELEERVFHLRRQLLGEEHPDTLAAMHNLACVSPKVGQKIRGLMLHEHVLELKRKVLGNEHPDTVNSARRLDILRRKLEEVPVVSTTYRNEAALKLKQTTGKLKRLFYSGVTNIL
ncbi:hypothetical protein DL96DRAFT_1638752 [Flagelloscypha sp. PMI_526]|nr:hypothetical protein DL96DRAFT_1638752 [Flagelloscypha sp. PMI_526]